MSMLSTQCDELRKLAGDGSMEWVAGPIRASILREAADTIWELRGMVHKERAEADRLREELEAVGTAAYLYGRDDLKAENANLRKLVRFANKTVEGLCEMVENSPGCFMCPLNQDEDGACGAAELFSRMRGLGVEI